MKKTPISLEKLAKQCKVTVYDGCEESWGGPYGFKQKGSNSSFQGFKTRQAALRAWFESEFDGELGAILLKEYFTIKED